MAAVHVVDLTKTYGHGHTAVDALTQASFDVDDGEFVDVGDCELGNDAGIEMLPPLFEFIRENFEDGVFLYSLFHLFPVIDGNI